MKREKEEFEMEKVKEVQELHIENEQLRTEMEDLKEWNNYLEDCMEVRDYQEHCMEVKD